MSLIGTSGSAHPTKEATELPGPPTPHVVAHGALMRRQDTTQLERAVSCLLKLHWDAMHECCKYF